jgi:DNA-binding GntR family transcriptional regulator
MTATSEQPTTRIPGQARLTPPPGTTDPRLWVWIADDLRQQLANGQITAGDPVSITHLTGQWHVCRQTVSKALRALVKDGLLICCPGLGYRVPWHSQPDPGTTT